MRTRADDFDAVIVGSGPGGAMAARLTGTHIDHRVAVARRGHRAARGFAPHDGVRQRRHAPAPEPLCQVQVAVHGPGTVITHHDDERVVQFAPPGQHRAQLAQRGVHRAQRATHRRRVGPVRVGKTVHRGELREDEPPRLIRRADQVAANRTVLHAVQRHDEMRQRAPEPAGAARRVAFRREAARDRREDAQAFGHELPDGAHVRRVIGVEAARLPAAVAAQRVAVAPPGATIARAVQPANGRDVETPGSTPGQVRQVRDVRGGGKAGDGAGPAVAWHHGGEIGQLAGVKQIFRYVGPESVHQQQDGAFHAIASRCRARRAARIERGMNPPGWARARPRLPARHRPGRLSATFDTSRCPPVTRTRRPGSRHPGPGT